MTARPAGPLAAGQWDGMDKEARAYRIYGGANEIMKLLIARSL